MNGTVDHIILYFEGFFVSKHSDFGVMEVLIFSHSTPLVISILLERDEISLESADISTFSILFFFEG